MSDIHATAEKIFEKFPCRFRSMEKTAFITEIMSQLKEMGYEKDDIDVLTHKGMMNSRNIVIGDPLKARRFITAHYDTPGRNGFLFFSSPLVGQTGANIVFFILMIVILSGLMWLFDIFQRAVTAGKVSDGTQLGLSFVFAFLPLVLFLIFFILIMVVKNPSSRNDNTSGVIAALDCADRLSDQVKAGKVCVVLFDNEEWGLVGSSNFASWLRKNKVDLKTVTVINIDCIGVGDKLVAATVGKPKAGTKAFLERLELPSLSAPPEEERGYLPQDRNGKVIRKRSMMIYMSDHANFPDSFMLCTMLSSRLGFLYLPNIHTAKDTECDVDMIDAVSERITDAVNGLLGQEDGATRYNN